jgi:hypothetical protein
MRLLRKTRTNRLSAFRNKRRTKSTIHRIKSCAKSSTNSKTKKAIIVENFIEMLNNIKLYHWNTHSFAQHKATDELHDRLSGHVDKFVEVLLGKNESRIRHLQTKIPLINNKGTYSFKEQVYQYREYFINMNKCLDSQRDSDLLNIRDEILGDINQFLYLLTLDK